jgi:hypothetical protein
MPQVDLIYGQTTKHRLTVCRDGSVRIKVAKDVSEDEASFIVTSFAKVAEQALKLNSSTLRGHVNKEDKFGTITLYTDSKKESYTYKLTENGQN